MDFGPDRWDMEFQLGSGQVLRHLLSRSLRHNLLDDLRDELVQRSPYGARLDEIGARNGALVDAVLETSGAKVFVGAAKDPIRVRYLRRIEGIDLRVIHLVRDAPGFVSSSMKNNGSTLLTSVRTWNRVANHADRQARVMDPSRWLRVRYEDLCLDVAGQLNRIAAFLGLPPQATPVRFRDVDHHIIGNRMRLSDSRDVRLDEKWRSRLSRRQIASVAVLTRRWRRRFGYV